LTFILPKKMQDLKPYRDQRGIDKIERISQKIIFKKYRYHPFHWY